MSNNLSVSASSPTRIEQPKAQSCLNSSCCRISAITFSILFATLGLTALIVTIYAAPKHLFFPLVTTSGFVLAASLIFLLVSLVCTQKRTQSTTQPVSSPAAIEKTTGSGLPGTFINEKLQGICSANAFLQALCALDDELKEKMYTVDAKNPRYNLVHPVAHVVKKLDSGQQISIQEMENIVDTFRTSCFVKGVNDGSANLNCRMSDFIQAFLGKNCLLDYFRDYPDAQGIKSYTSQYYDGGVSTFSDLMAHHQGNPHFSLQAPLPKTIIVECANAMASPENILPDDEKGYYHCKAFDAATQSDITYKYKLKAMILNPEGHFTTAVANGVNSFKVYDDAQVYTYNQPLRLKQGFVTAIFEMVEGTPRKLP